MLKWLTILLLFITGASSAADIYVAVNGDDNNAGTKERPMATLAAALRKARDLRRLNDASIENGITIILAGGVYTLHESIFIRPEDAGTEKSPTIIKGADGEQPILSGGVTITGWKNADVTVSGLPQVAKGKVWVASLPDVNGSMLQFRQLWVDGKKAVRAKSANGDTMHRILNWNKHEQTCMVRTADFPDVRNVSGVEMFIHQWWAVATLRVKKMERHADSTKLFFHQPESRIQSEHPWPAPWISNETGNSAYYLCNAIEFLDEPGEWWLDATNRKIYYWPRRNENMQRAKVVAPLLETLVNMQGSIEHPVANIYFKGISFQHTGWLRPSLYGHVPHQAGMYMTDAYRLKPAGTPARPMLDNQAWIGRPAAAVTVSFAERTGFENCRFEHLASTGLDYFKGVHHNTIKGNLFKDIGGNGILAAVFSNEGSEIHLPYNPKDEREICDSLEVSNNLITDVTNEDWGCVGIGVGYSRNTLIEHNEVENISYSGVSMGWGWNPAANAMHDNKIISNKIHHYGKHNYDCAGIYTLSAQPNSVISGNYIDSIYKAPYAHLPSHWFYIYCDEGSSYFTVKDNWTPTQKYLQNANGPGNVWTNNGPQVSVPIKEQAGLLPGYYFLLKEKTSNRFTWPINEEHNEVIEMVVKQGTSLDLPKLRRILQQNNMDSSAIYQWQNHYVIFSKVQDIGVMQGRLQNNFPGATVKVYYNLFYEFSRHKHCADTSTAREWQHIILTANLVENKTLQQEYMNYHATQFENWPEVAQGFCNAGFQQLLLFRSGRQLMLVISIPKGESLDQLNPKTTAGNPRMDEWNKRMKKYQVGIEGTKPDEVWVFFQQLQSNSNK